VRALADPLARAGCPGIDVVSSDRAYTRVPQARGDMKAGFAKADKANSGVRSHFKGRVAKEMIAVINLPPESGSLNRESRYPGLKITLPMWPVDK
jgi:hypothetical protein